MEKEFRGEEQSENNTTEKTDEKENETELTNENETELTNENEIEDIEDVEIIDNNEITTIDLSEDTLKNIYEYIDSKFEINNTNTLSNDIDINAVIIEKLDSLIFWIEILSSLIMPLLLFVFVFYIIFKEFVS